MAGEWTAHDWTATNVANANLQTPGVVMAIDVANSLAQKVAVAICAAAGHPIGVLVDKVKLDINGAVLPGQGVHIRSHGSFWLPCTAAVVTAGDYVAVSGAAGFVATAVRAAAGAQPTPIVGQALTTTSGTLGDTALVLLMIGQTF